MNKIKLLSDKHSQGEFSDAQVNVECEQLTEEQRSDYIALLSQY